MLASFLAFNINALNNFIYLLTSNLWSFLMIIALAGTVILRLKEEIDMSVREEQNVI